MTTHDEVPKATVSRKQLDAWREEALNGSLGAISKLHYWSLCATEPRAQPSAVGPSSEVVESARYWSLSANAMKDNREYREAFERFRDEILRLARSHELAIKGPSAFQEPDHIGAKLNAEQAALNARSSTATITDQEGLALVERLQRAASNLFDADMLTDCETVREAARQLLCVPSAIGTRFTQEEIDTLSDPRYGWTYAPAELRRKVYELVSQLRTTDGGGA